MKIGRIVCLCLMLLSLVVLLPLNPVLAQDEEIEPKIDLEPTYRKLEATNPGASFEFEVGLNYIGEEARDFDLLTTGPQDWTTYVKPSYGDQRIGSIRLEPFSATNKVKVVAIPPLFINPEPGDYEINLEASSGDIRASVDLTAVITDTYALSLVPTLERYNTKATAGKDNYFSIDVENTGSGALENIKFSSSKPSGWTVEFTPEKVDTLLSTDLPQTVDVNIKPDRKAIAGDYQITLTADAKQIAEDIKIRVTVETPTVWGWVGIGIILVVVAGVSFIFMRFSRR